MAYADAAPRGTMQPPTGYQNARQENEAKPTMELPQAMEQLNAARVRLIDLTKDLHVRLESALSPATPSPDCPARQGRIYGSPLACAIDEQCKSLWVSIDSIEEILRRIQL